MSQIAVRTFHDIRAAPLARRELALFDVRGEDPLALAHPLFAANLLLPRLELEIHARVPRRDTSITVYDDGEGLAPVVAQRLLNLGYSDMALLDGGLSGWRNADGKLFRDVNVPSKAFGELVKAGRHTPSLAAEEVQALLDARVDAVILDARRFDEYQTMSIPGGINVPGAELVLCVAELAPDPRARVIVSCVGCTRSIIGTQSLLNAGIPNPVVVLRNGTIGRTLAGQQLEHGQTRCSGAISQDIRKAAAQRVRVVADCAGVERLDLAGPAQWQDEHDRTAYLPDVRVPEEYKAGHLPGSRSMPGGQLVQEIDHVASVHGARLVLVDDDGVRANMSASWLARMGWQVAVLGGLSDADFSERGAWSVPLPKQPRADTIDPIIFAGWPGEPGTRVLDFTVSANYMKCHIPGAAQVLRSQLKQALERLGTAERHVLTYGSSPLARSAVAEVQTLSGKPVFLLDSDTNAWVTAGLLTEDGESLLALPHIDCYRRPYEGTDNLRRTMQGYLDWEFGLVEQLGRDEAHGFFAI